MVVLVLYYLQTFVREELQKFWIRYGTEDHTRYLPIHFMYEKMGANFCSNLLKAYILTGYGTKIKVVPKKGNKSKPLTIRGVIIKGCLIQDKMCNF